MTFFINNKGNNHRVINLEHGELHTFANETVFKGFEKEIFNMADNNLRIPRNVYLSYTPDAHVGVGTCIGTTAVWKESDGFISPSIVGSDIGCGMRVVMTNVHKDDIKDKSTRRALINGIEKYVDTQDEKNFRKRRHHDPIVGYFADNINLKEVLTNGVSAVSKDFGMDGMFDIENHKFNVAESALEVIHQKVWESAKYQIGTLGGGNHFIEIQSIEIAEEKREVAENWGLFDGQVVIMIHSGSRVWGGKIGVKAVKEFKAVMNSWGVTNTDPNLVYAPIDSDEGRVYYNLMLSALNYAVVNRHMMGYAVSEAFKDVLGKDVETKVLYDLMHNYALKEPHRNKLHMVHRKGATRALPAGHFLNPSAYKETGHPALIPGSMGTSSYIMLGRDEGIKNFYSICHGSGRVRSRRATRELVTVDEFESSMKVGTDEEILVNQRTLESILDESPQAYKDVDQIIDSVVGSKLADVVAKCKPMAVIKGV